MANGRDFVGLKTIPIRKDFFHFIVKCPVQMSGAGVRLILRSTSGSVQLKNLGFKSLTIGP